ncbi:hypothetical protein HOG21_05535 [bacterium]|jgi:hypothetical protein|nr:hypothetical protein [bacterium]
MPGIGDFLKAIVQQLVLPGDIDEDYFYIEVEQIIKLGNIMVYILDHLVVLQILKLLLDKQKKTVFKN